MMQGYQLKKAVKQNSMQKLYLLTGEREPLEEFDNKTDCKKKKE